MYLKMRKKLFREEEYVICEGSWGRGMMHVECTKEKSPLIRTREKEEDSMEGQNTSHPAGSSFVHVK